MELMNLFSGLFSDESVGLPGIIYGVGFIFLVGGFIWGAFIFIESGSWDHWTDEGKLWGSVAPVITFLLGCVLVVITFITGSKDRAEFSELVTTDEVIQACVTVMEESLSASELRGVDGDVIAGALARDSFVLLGSRASDGFRGTVPDSKALYYENGKGLPQGYYLDCYRVLLDAGEREDLTYMVSDAHLRGGDLPARKL